MQPICRFLTQALAAAALAYAAFAAPARAEGPAAEACRGFDWPLDREWTALTQGPAENAADGGAIRLGVAAEVKLKPVAEVAYKQPPERAPKVAPAFGAVLALPAVPAAGLYQVTLSQEAWLDVVQNGARLKSVSFSGRKGCVGMRKSVRFEFAAAPAFVQISGAAADAIRIVVAPAQ